MSSKPKFLKIFFSFAENPAASGHCDGALRVKTNALNARKYISFPPAREQVSGRVSKRMSTAERANGASE